MKTTYQLLFQLLMAIVPLAAMAQGPLVLTANLTHVGCSYGFTGAIDLTVTGGTPGYTYQWANMAGNTDPEDRTQLFPGTYCVTVTDAVGLTASDCYEITDPECPVVFRTFAPYVSANGQPVTIIADALGGTPPFMYNWSNFNINPQITVNPASNTTYTVTVTDANGCTRSNTYPVTVVGNTPSIVFEFFNTGCGLSGYHSAIVHLYNFPAGVHNYTLTPTSPFLTTVTGTFTGNSFELNDICTIGCQYTLVVNGPGSVSASKMFGDPNSVIGLYATSSLQIESYSPALCLPSGANQCERVCPNTTATYHAGPFSPFCDGSTLSNFVWIIKGAQSYVISADGSEATITWGDSGSGNIEVNSEGLGCFKGTRCIEIVEVPEAKMLAVPGPAPTDTALTICRGQSVHFESQSFNADLFEWQFGDDGSNLTGANSVHNFDQAGTFPVALIARSLCSCADTTVLQVTVLDSPVPALNCVSAVCPGTSATYTTPDDCGDYIWSVSSNGIITGGGGIADDSISVQWLDGVNGSISLELQNCSSAACPVKTTVPVPVISNSAEIKGNAFVCIQSEEVYSIDAFDGSTYEWSIIPQNTNTPTIIDGQGTPRIRVRIGNFGNAFSVVVKYNNCYLECSGADTLPFIIRRPTFITGKAQACEGQPENYSTANKSNWTVYGPSGTVIETFTNLNVITPLLNQGPGEYLLVAIPTAATQNFTCSQRMEWKVTLSASPPQPISIDGPSCFCPGSTQVYTAQAGFYQVIWTNSFSPDEDWGNPYNLNVPLNSNTAIWVAARSVAFDGSGCMSDTVRRWIDPLETPKIFGPAQSCTGTIANYNTNPDIQGLQYQWEIIPSSAGIVTSGHATANAGIFWIKPGTHTLRVSICGKSTTIQVTVNNPQTPLPLHSAGVCKGMQTQVSVPGSWNSILWETAAHVPISSDSNILVGPGTYVLQVVDDNGCSSAGSFQIAEYPEPNISISTADPTGFCNNSYNVTMYALTDHDDQYVYEWFRDGLPLGVATNTLVTNQYGLYTAQVTNIYGCTASDGSIRVFEACGGPPTFEDPELGPACLAGAAHFDVLPTARCDSFIFKVQNNPNVVPGTASWYFGQSGDDFIGNVTGDSVSFVLPNGGKYLVFLVVDLTDGTKCVLFDQFDVDVIADFRVSVACPGDSSLFLDESTRLPDKIIDTWEWAYGDPSGGSYATHSFEPAKYPYDMPGIYTATLTVTSASGCSSSISKLVEIPELPNFTLAPQINGCSDQVLLLSALPINEILHMDWTFGQPGSGNNTASGLSVYHYFGSLPGTFTVKATAYNIWGCVSNASQPAVISNNTLSGDILASGPLSICAGETVSLTAPFGGASYAWSNGASGQTIAVGTEGVYQVTVTAPSGCSYSPAAMAVNISPTPTGFIQGLVMNEYGQNIGFANGSMSVCAGDDVNLLANTFGNYQYEWLGSAETSQTITFTDARDNLLAIGNYTYIVTITDPASGCTFVTPSFTVNVNPVPNGFSAVADQPCAGIPTEVSYEGPINPNWNMAWNNGLSGLSFVTTQPGRYIVRVTNEFGCSASSEPAIIWPGPNIQAIPQGCHTRCTPDTMCLPAMPGIVDWQWYLNGSAIPGATQPNFVAEMDGTYTVEMTDTLGCSALSDPLSLTLYSGFGSVFGNVWVDVNNNSIIDAADTLISGITVLLLENTSTIANGQSAQNGAVVFANIPATTYNLLIDSAGLDPFWGIVIAGAEVNLVGCNAADQGDMLISHCTAAPTVLALETCPGSSANYLGTDIPVGQTQQFTLPGSTGCDSVILVTVNPLSVSSGSFSANICPGATYNYQGVDLSVGQTQAFTLTNAAGCDSIVTVTVGALPISSSSLSANICPGATYSYQGVDLSAGQMQAFTLTNAAGCDSIVTVSVGALPISSSSLSANICPGATYNYLGVDLSVGQTQAFTLTNAAGCDSVVTVTVAALPVPNTTLGAFICAGATYEYQGVQLTVGQVQAFTLASAAGCDSIVTVFVSALPNSASSFSASVCPGATYQYQGVDLAIGQTQSFTLANVFGCDSVVTVTVNALPVLSSSFSASICPGATYPYQGANLTVGQTQSFTLSNAAGCDSIVTVSVFEKANSLEQREVKVCPGESYLFEGEALAIGTEKDFHFTNAVGCDSTINIVVEALPDLDFEVKADNTCPNGNTGAIDISVLPGGSLPAGFSLNGVDYQSDTQFGGLGAGTYTISVKDENGCLFAQPAVIDASPNLELELPDAFIIPCDSALVTLVPQLGGDTVGLHLNWSNGAQSPTISTAQAGSVWLEASNHCGETLYREAEVLWADAGGEPIQIYVPNVFAPESGNPENTMFRAFFGNNLQLLEYRLEVYDRWGNMLFETEKPEVGWTGPFRNKMMDPAVFVWQLWVKIAFCGREMDLYKKGDVTIER